MAPPNNNTSWLDIAPMETHYEKPDRSSKSSLLSIDEPPTYEAQAPIPRQRNKWSVQPRENEGQEELPAYSASISLENVFTRKLEVEGAVYKAYDRCWYREYVTLRGTVLIVHKLKRHIFSRPEKPTDDDPDMPVGAEQGSLVKSYNLQLAEVGIAADYTKKNYVIRVRAETDQFLLSCTRIETFITWLRSLFMAIDLALPLDERRIPEDHSVPRRRRCRQRSRDRPSTAERHTALVRQQMDIMRMHYPNLAQTDSSTEESDTEGDQINADNFRAMFGVLPMRSEPTRQVRESAPSSERRNTRSSSTPPHRQTVTRLRRPTVSALTEDGKWRPDHGWCSRYDMIYAKRCMAVLERTAPRKSKLLVIKGKQYSIDWSTGDLESLEPPAYNGKDHRHKLRIGRYGQVMKF